MLLSNKYICLLLLLTLSACKKGPVPVLESDVESVVKVDTAFFREGWITGDDLFEIRFSPAPDHSRVFVVLVGVLVILVTGAALFLENRYSHRKELRKQAEESRLVLSLLKEKVSMISTLSAQHKATLEREEKGSYLDELEAMQAIIKDYHDYLEELRGNLSFMGDLESALNAARDGVMRKARLLLGQNIDEMDYFILACCLAGMKPASISFITNVKPGTIRTKKSRLKARISQMPPSANRDLVLEGLDTPT